MNTEVTENVQAGIELLLGRVRAAELFESKGIKVTGDQLRDLMEQSDEDPARAVRLYKELKRRREYLFYDLDVEQGKIDPDAWW